MRFRCYFMLLALMVGGCTAQTEAACTGHSLDEYLGTYRVSEVEQFRGGLTGEAAARDRIGDEVVIAKDRVSSEFYSSADPYYAISCHPVKAESGEVSNKRWSNFYGLGLDRSSIDVLEVYSPSDEDGEPSYYFEIVEGALWELFDGWKYELTPRE